MKTETTTPPPLGADNLPLQVGDVILHIEDGDRGVVTRIIAAGDTCHFPTDPGSMVVSSRPGSSRITNRFSFWKHIPHDEQTYHERHQAWLTRPLDQDRLHDLYGESLSYDVLNAIEGILALLPEGTVEWEDESYPFSIESALGYLEKHLTRLTAKA